MRTRILMLLIGSVLLFSGKAHAQWVVTDPGNFAEQHRQFGQGR